MRVLGGRFLTEADLSGFKSLGTNIMVHETAILVDTENISIGSNVRIDPFCVLSAAGGFIRLGGYNHIASGVKIIGGGGVTLEAFAGLSQNVSVYSASDDYSGGHLTGPTVPEQYLGVDRREVVLGRHAIVGSGAVILPGCSLGEGVSVGALALVTKPLAPWGIYAGSPAKRVRARSDALLQMEAALTDPHHEGRAVAIDAAHSNAS